jgi:hypothetical protein
MGVRGGRRELAADSRSSRRLGMWGLECTPRPEMRGPRVLAAAAAVDGCGSYMRTRQEEGEA